MFSAITNYGRAGTTYIRLYIEERVWFHANQKPCSRTSHSMAWAMVPAAHWKKEALNLS